MFPTLVRVGPFSLATYGVLVAAGAMLAIQWAKREIVERDALLDEDAYWNIVYWVLGTAFVGAKLMFIVHFWDRYESWWEILASIRYGFVYYGGLIGAVGFFLWRYRRDRAAFWKLADRALPALALAHAVGRVGCFFAGCCHGTPCDLPWAVTFTDPDSLVEGPLLGVPLHPAQLYDAAGNFLLAAFLGLWALPAVRARRLASGSVAALYGLGYFVLRFLVEFVRGDDRGGFVALGLTSYQWISILGAAAAAVFLATRQKGRMRR